MAWLRRYIERPQQLWLRKAFLQVHLWAGLIAALYIVAIGISGSILVFKDELLPRPHFVGARSDVNACTPAQLLRAMHAAVQAYRNQSPVLASCPTHADPFFAINLLPTVTQGRQLTVYVDPNTARIAGALDQDASWIGFVDRFHLELFLAHKGRQWNGVGAAILLLLVLTGLVLWWPGLRNWTRAFKISLRSNWKRINWDLHSATGIWTLFFTFTWATTGVYFAFPKPFEAATRAISSITTAQYPATQMARLEARPLSTAIRPLDLPGVLQQGIAASPGAHLEGFFFGSGPKPILTVYMARKQLGDYANTDFIYFDQVSGEHLLTWHRGQNHTLGDWLIWLSTPLHFGTSWGLPGKLAWAALGLALPLLTVSGLILYWNRSLRRWLK